MADDAVKSTNSDHRPEDEAGVAVLIADGVAALEDGRREDAEAAFRKAVAREPDNPDALRRLGVAVFLGGDFEDARGLLELAIGLAPDDADAHNNLAAILLEQGEITEAETRFRRARELLPDDADINFNLGLILLQRGNVAEARDCFKAVISVRPDDADAHHNLGMTWRREKGREAAAAALAAFRRAVEIDGDDCDSLVELSALLREEGCLTEALATSERALQTHGDDPAVAFNHGAILYELGRYDVATRYFQRALAADVPDNRAHDYLGRTLVANRDVDGAIRAFRRGLEVLPDSHRLKRNLRDAYSRLVPSWHLTMINDTSRIDAYQAVIDRCVREDDIVLDIGAGNGLLAMMAARAGARKVVACETLGPMADMARRIVARNGYADVITILPKQSTELVVGVDLPEPASVVISEILDVTLIGEGVIPALRHATRHLMRSDARVIPVGARVWGALIEWPSERAINPVREIRGFDFSDINLFRNPNSHVPFDAQQEAHRVLSDPFPIASFDFHNPPDFSEADRVETVTAPAIETGTGHAVTVWFELDLDGETTFSSQHVTNLNHLHCTAQFLDRDLPVHAGREFRLRVLRNDSLFSLGAVSS